MAERPSRPARPSRPPAQESDADIAASLMPSSEEDFDDFDFESDVKIDPNFLDAEFLQHPGRFLKYSLAAAKANKALRLAEERVKTVRSIIVRREKESNPKHTETTLEAAYRVNPEYREAKSDYVDASFKADTFNNVVFVMQARKAALENLVRLHGQGYNSTPEEPRDLPEASKRLSELKIKIAENHIKNKTGRRGER